MAEAAGAGFLPACCWASFWAEAGAVDAMAGVLADSMAGVGVAASAVLAAAVPVAGVRRVAGDVTGGAYGR